MFKYLWIAILIIIYVIWGLGSLIDIIDVYKNYFNPRRDNFEDFWNYLDDGTQIFVALTIIGVLPTSFGRWFYTIISNK